jgi:putative peptide maturation dehydrogenase
MHVRRPAHLRFEYRHSPEDALRALLSASRVADGKWLVSAAHLDGEVEVGLEDLAVFQAVPEEGIAAAELEARFGADRVHHLLARGVLLSDRAEHALHARNDDVVRAANWWGPAAIMQRLGRWDGVDVAEVEAADGRRRVGGMIESNGPPPPEALSLRPSPERRALPQLPPTDFDALLGARATCRNFDSAARVTVDELARVLKRVFGAQASQELAPGATMLKKNSPSGGGLHPIEAFLLVQRVEDFAPGLYHYQCVEHALEPLRELPAEQAAAAAHELVAGQAWFANAPVLLLMAARFPRTFWKYRHHAKAWKVIQLDAGHLSQNLYLSATELGYGAFITGAINDRCAERLFELDGLGTGAIAVCGFGKRAAQGSHVEFDPLGKVVR